MKKLVGVAVLSAVVALAPASAFAHYKKNSHKHNHAAHDEVIGVGAGALAGAVVAGPIGAVVGGVAGLFIVKHGDY